MGVFGTTGKCPHCGKSPTYVIFDSIIARDNPLNPKGWKTLIYSCPDCNAILSAQIDPVAVRAEVCEHIDLRHKALTGELQQVKNMIGQLSDFVGRLLRQQR